MAITVDSSQWTGQRDETPLAVPVVWGEFADEAARDAAAAQLRAAGATDADNPPAEQQGGVAPPRRAVNEGQVDPPDEHPKAADQRNQRQLKVGTAMAATSMAAAGLVIATGGAALPAFAAAVATGAATAAIGEPIAQATNPQADQKPQVEPPVPPARLNGPALGIQAPDADMRARAERMLREVGASRILVQENRYS